MYYNTSSTTTTTKERSDSSWGFAQSGEILVIENVSRADYEDVPCLKKLISANTSIMFNTEDVLEKIHNTAVSILVKNHKGTVVAGICMTDYPNIPALPSDDWVAWVKRLYGLHELNGYNTFWVHLVVYDDLYESSFIEPMMKYLFLRNTKDYVLFVVPPNCHFKVGYLKDISTMILPNDYKISNKVQTLRMLMRQNFSIAYKVRRAVEEDNDDLVPLIDNYSPLLRNLYGDFYVAELLTRHPDAGRQLIVAEHKGLAVSVLCLNENVNYQDLNQSFDLQVFSGLFKPHTFKKISTDKESAHTVYTINTMFKASLISAINAQQRMSYSAESHEDTFNECASSKYDGSLSLDLDLPTDNDKNTRNVRMTTEVLETVGDDNNHSGLDFSEIIGEGDISDDGTSLEIIYPKQKYVGVENAFVVEIAACQPEHEYSLELLLEASFECFPNKDYCILTVPSNKPYFNFLRQFIRVTPRRTSLHPHELYVVHKIMLNPVSVRVATAGDLDVMKEFANLMEHPGNLEEKFSESINDPKSKLMTFFLISGRKHDHPLGVVMVNEVTDLDQLKVTYCIGSWHDMRREKNENVGVIEYFTMSPFFRRQTRFFLREIHRMSSYHTLFYAMNRYDNSMKRNRPLPAILPHLYPIKPRKIVIRGRTGAPTYEEPFSLYLATPRLTGVCRFEINTRIVVVGSSYSAIAFLEALLFSEHRKDFSIFNNVTLVSKHGICHSKPPNNLTAMMQARASTLDYEYLERLNLRCYINIIHGMITSIDRNNQTITVDKKQQLPYDLLFLMCGVQYNVPRKLGIKDYLSVKLATNMFNINTEMDAEIALTTLKHLTSEYKNQKYTILVVGYTIDAYCCIAALLEFGVAPYCLTFVDQFGVMDDGPPNNDFVFQDGDIFETVVESLKTAGVNVLSGFKLIDWWTAVDGKQIIVKFESHLRFIEIQAIAVFLFPEKSVKYANQ